LQFINSCRNLLTFDASIVDGCCGPWLELPIYLGSFSDLKLFFSLVFFRRYRFASDRRIRSVRHSYLRGKAALDTFWGIDWKVAAITLRTVDDRLLARSGEKEADQ